MMLGNPSTRVGIQFVVGLTSVLLSLSEPPDEALTTPVTIDMARHGALAVSEAGNAVAGIGVSYSTIIYGHAFTVLCLWTSNISVSLDPQYLFRLDKYLIERNLFVSDTAIAVIDAAAAVDAAAMSC